MTLETICHLEVGPGYHLRVTYTDGVSVVADIEPMIRRGGVFAPLAHPDEFAKVSVGPRGRYVEWPGGADLCADALRMHPRPEGRVSE
jgi:hypothetical protein